jgi:hypothetical protein
MLLLHFVARRTWSIWQRLCLCPVAASPQLCVVVRSHGVKYEKPVEDWRG